MRLMYQESTDKFFAVGSTEAIDEAENVIPITPELIVTLVPVFTGFFDWLFARFSRSPEERAAARAWWKAKRDGRRAHQLKKLELRLEKRNARKAG